MLAIGPNSGSGGSLRPSDMTRRRRKREVRFTIPIAARPWDRGGTRVMQGPSRRRPLPRPTRRSRERTSRENVVVWFPVKQRGGKHRPYDPVVAKRRINTDSLYAIAGAGAGTCLVSGFLRFPGPVPGSDLGTLIERSARIRSEISAGNEALGPLPALLSSRPWMRVRPHWFSDTLVGA